MPAVSSPRRASAAFKRNCSSSSTTAVRSVNRHTAAWKSPSGPAIGETVTPRCFGLAPVTVKTIFDNLQQINAQGTSVLLVEQNVPRALGLSHRGYVIENGRIVLHGASADLAQSPHIRQAYLGV